ALEDALNVSEQRDRESNTKIADLGRRLNVALAQRVQELNRYRSDFFGRLREILADRENIRIVGDRFVFQSEVLFPTGSDEINDAGKVEMKKLADAVIELQREIPPEISWVLRVDGHTDNKPLSGTGRYRDNWELSTARATSVVKFLIENGVPANRLVAAGFGEFQPLDPADTDEARSKNRRIELKLTER
ncbi:peptidoglycan -binding protein, partial [Mesorhizobium sp. M1A.F.Ca.IN.022.07.1.1]